MTIIVSKHNNAVLNYGEATSILSNGYICLTNENVSYIPSTVTAFEVKALPDDYADGKYCYTEKKGFYVNPNYVESTNEDDVKDNMQAIGELGEYIATLEARIATLEGGKN